MLTKRTLRALIVADFLLVVLGVGFGLLTQSSLPEPLWSYVKAQRDADLTVAGWIAVGVGIPMLIAIIVSSIGLFLFWRLARPLYAGALIAGVILSALGEPLVEVAWVQAIGFASNTLSGVVLALVYWSPLNELYEKPKSSA